MKISFVFVILLISVSTSPPDFPKYNAELLKPLGSCSCSGAFSSCAKTCDRSTECTCTCSAFSCSCTSCEKIIIQLNGVNYLYDNTPISISEQQYNNWAKLAEILRTINSSSSDHSYLLLITMVDNLSKQQYSEYRKNALTFERGLLSFSSKDLATVNNFLYSVGANLHNHS